MEGREHDVGVRRRCGKLIEVTTAVIEKHTPNLRPSTYSKRWFIPDLKTPQTEVNHLRRKWQESYA